MKRDFKSCMLYAVFGLPIFLILFIVLIYVGNCGFSADCSQASLPSIIHTPIPTLIPATLPSQGKAAQAAAQAGCLVTARSLLAAWVTSGFQDTALFQFTDIKGNTCQATFKDVQPLFTQANTWYSGALACSQCHNPDIPNASANMDLSTYDGILAGGKRSSPDAKGEDILGGGNWEQSKLNDMLFVKKTMPFGRPPGAVAPDGPTVYAGTLASAPSLTPTVGSSQEDVARPSNPGEPGDAINLNGDVANGEKVFIDHCQLCHGPAGTDNVPNPGSNDGTVPPLNPIDLNIGEFGYADLRN